MNKTSMACTFFILLTCTIIPAQPVNQSWTARYDGAGSLDKATTLAVGNDGYLYVAGKSAGGLSGNDYLTIKYDPDGAEVWITRTDFGPDGNDSPHDIVLDNAGGVYVTGSGNGHMVTLKYNSSSGDTIWSRSYRPISNQTSTGRKMETDGRNHIYVAAEIGYGGNPASTDIGLIKYNSEGDSLWFRIFEGSGGADSPNDLFVDRSGNVYITGKSDTLGLSDAIVIKYNSVGKLKWAHHFGKAKSVQLNAITVDEGGNVYATGKEANAAVIVKYDSLGTKQWVEYVDHPLYAEEFVDMLTDGRFVYLFGVRRDKYMTYKYSASGDTAWGRYFPASGGGGLPTARAMAIDRFNSVYVTGNRGTSTSGHDYLTVKYSSNGKLQWSREYNGSAGTFDEAEDIGVDMSGNVYVTGVSMGAGTEEDFLTIKYGQPSAGNPLECWLTETFDLLLPASLNGQNEWVTVPGRSDAYVVANPFGPGQVLRMDAGPNQTVIMNRNINDQDGGKHTLKLDVLVDGDLNSAQPTLAKVEFRTNGNPDWDKKFQLYFGAHMRLNYGPHLSDAIEFLPAQELVKRRWYQVEAVLDGNSNTVDIFLDGKKRLEKIAVGPGAITEIGISAWDRPGLVYYDNLNFCRTSAAQAGACAAQSFFDYDDESWSVSGMAQGPDWRLTGGSPGGYISATASGSGSAWYWLAPAEFLGDAACAYGRALNYDLRQSASGTALTDREDVLLSGNGLRLVYQAPYVPGTDWTSFSVALVDTAGWKLGRLTGPAAGPADMMTVLSSLDSVKIRGNYSTGSATSDLDNVIMGAAPKGVGPLPLFSYQIKDDSSGSSSGDGDGRIEAGERVELQLQLYNAGVNTARAVNATLSSEDEDITILTGGDTWPDISAGAARWSRGGFVLEASAEMAEEKVVTFEAEVLADNGGPWINTLDESVSPQNLPPVPVTAIPDTSVAMGDTLLVRDLNCDPAVFHDPDQDLSALTYSGKSNDPNIAAALIEGSRLKVAGMDSGSTIIRVYADDGRGGLGLTSFELKTILPLGLRPWMDKQPVSGFSLEQNYPNPLNPVTTVSYFLPRAVPVRLTIYNFLGQRIKLLASERQAAGRHTVIWDGTNDEGMRVGSGLYFYMLQAGKYHLVRKMVLLR